eukprot:3886330-Lingulodinium_polyedra.AAC.1
MEAGLRPVWEPGLTLFLSTTECPCLACTSPFLEGGVSVPYQEHRRGSEHSWAEAQRRGPRGR